MATADKIKKRSSEHVPLGYKKNSDDSYSMMVSSTNSDGASAADREIVFITYRVKTAFTGASVGDTVTQMRVINLTGESPVIESTTWYNDSTAATLGTAPAAADIEPLASGGITNAQMSALLAGIATAARQDAMSVLLTAIRDKLIATPATEATLNAINTALATMSGKLPATLGAKTAGASLSVVPATDANVSREVYSAVTIVTATAGAAAATFASQACSSLDLVNTSTVDIEYQRGGTGTFMPVLAGTSRLIQGITNANQIGVRRRDLNATTVAVFAEAFAV